MSFEIKMKDDQVIKFRDIITLSDTQRVLITDVSFTKTFEEWVLTKTGVKIPLEEKQMTKIINQKNLLISSKSERALLKNRTIIFSKHALSRIALRVDGLTMDDQPSLDSMLLIITLVIESNIVDKYAEWKGFENLAYTLIHSRLKEKFKITVSFEVIDNDLLRVITISNEHIQKLTVTLMESPEISQKLAELKKKLFS